MTHEQRLKLLATAVRLAHGEDWHVTASFRETGEHAWSIERRTKGGDFWIGRGQTLEDALVMASTAYAGILRGHVEQATRIAAQLSA